MLCQEQAKVSRDCAFSGFLEKLVCELRYASACLNYHVKPSLILFEHISRQVS